MRARRAAESTIERADDLRSSYAGGDLRSSLARSGERRTVHAEDVAVAAKLIEGDAHAAVALAARAFGPAVGRLCFLLLGSQGEADEAAQETFLAAYHGASTYRADGSARSWLFGIARRICAQRLATRARQARRLVMLVVPGEGEDDASVLHDSAEREAEVRSALSTLPSADREVLALRYDGEHSFREIADALGIDEATARKRVGRALVRLRERVRAR